MTTLRQDIIERMNHTMRDGGDLSAAAKAVVKAFIRGQSAAFVSEFGQEIVEDLWRQSNIRSRYTARNGTRRIETGELQSASALLDALYHVAGRYVCLGDMTKGECREAQRFFNTLAVTNAREAYMFSRIADNLRGSEHVRSKFTDDQVRSLLEEFKVE